MNALTVRGEFLILRGPSGCGKTTLLNIIGTIDNPTSGVIEIADFPITVETKDHILSNLRLAKIGFVFQTFNLLDSLTAIENVELPMIALNKLNAKERRERGLSLLKCKQNCNQVTGLEDRCHHLPSELSGGERQRV